MARKIKFRAWHLPSKQMVEVNDLAIRIEMINQGNSTGIPYSEIKLMQFTGQKDRNGKDIYEGDIISVSGHVQYHGKKMKVIFGAMGCRATYKTKWDQVWVTLGREIGLLQVEVIGNIYENKELLKSNKDE